MSFCEFHATVGNQQTLREPSCTLVTTMYGKIGGFLSADYKKTNACTRENEKDTVGNFSRKRSVLFCELKT